MRIRGREYLHCDDDSRNEIDEGHPNPHHGAGELLVPQRWVIEELRVRGVCGIDNTTAKSEKRRERIARYRSEEQIQGNKPPIPPLDTWPRLDNRPPEKKPSSEEAYLLEIMPSFGLEGQIEGAGNMPCDHADGTGKPAKNRIGENAPNSIDRYEA
jgi:hypothetical protein